MKKIGPILLGLILLLCIWQLVTVIGGHDAALFPPPLDVLTALIEIIKDGSIFEHIQISLFRFFSGYLLAVVVAVIWGFF